jgi:hypothetical protein
MKKLAIIASLTAVICACEHNEILAEAENIDNTVSQEDGVIVPNEVISKDTITTEWDNRVPIGFGVESVNGWQDNTVNLNK